jgi:hypothetical protein
LDKVSPEISSISRSTFTRSIISRDVSDIEPPLNRTKSSMPGGIWEYGDGPDAALEEKRRFFIIEPVPNYETFILAYKTGFLPVQYALPLLFLLRCGRTPADPFLRRYEKRYHGSDH